MVLEPVEKKKVKGSYLWRSEAASDQPLGS